MRLINIHTLEFGEFIGEVGAQGGIPYYAMLSHRWGAEEITWKDFLKKRNQEKAGYRKVLEFCDFLRGLQLREHSTTSTRHVQAFETPVEWVWIDTCCIDKKSSAELSEAINSMFEWYKKAVICVAYLSDFHQHPAQTKKQSLSKCSWFSRGWTLQELIAPSNLFYFCDRQFNILGRLENVAMRQIVLRSLLTASIDLLGPQILNQEIGEITTIPQDVLCHSMSPRSYSIAERMSWAATRKTTRVEDQAYSLLGLFGVNIPLIYGEGSRAFRRLQEEIVKTRPDHSILAHASGRNVLADAPAGFLTCGDIEWNPRAASHIAFTNLGTELRADLYVMKHDISDDAFSDDASYLLELNCFQKTGVNGSSEPVILPLKEVGRLNLNGARSFYKWNESIRLWTCKRPVKNHYEKVFMDTPLYILNPPYGDW